MRESNRHSDGRIDRGDDSQHRGRGATCPRNGCSPVDAPGESVDAAAVTVEYVVDVDLLAVDDVVGRDHQPDHRPQENIIT